MYVLHLFITLSTCVLQERVLSMVTPSNFETLYIRGFTYDIPGIYQSCGIIRWLCLEVTNMTLDFVTLIVISLKLQQWSILLRSSENVKVNSSKCLLCEDMIESSAKISAIDFERPSDISFM